METLSVLAMDRCAAACEPALQEGMSLKGTCAQQSATLSERSPSSRI